jgi:competence protein ComEC
MLPSLTAAFIAGLVLGSQLPFFPVVLTVLLVAVATGLCACEHVAVITPRRATALYVSLLSGILYWTVAAPQPSAHRMLMLWNRGDATMREVIGRVVAPVQHAPGRLTVILESEKAMPDGSSVRAPGLLRLVWRDPGPAPHHGDRIQFHAKLHPPTGSFNPGGFDYAAYLERQGIEAVGTVSGPDAVRVISTGGSEWGWAVWNRIDRWRGTIRDAAIRSLEQPALGVFLGIVIGERGYLDQELQDWFMVTGTVHLLSISGSHLGLVAFVMFWLVRYAVLRLPSPWLLTLSRVLTPSRVAVILTWPVVALYTLLAGAELATVRSLVMITVGLATVWLGYERHLRHATAAGAILIVAHDPRAVFDISFQLSFLSVLTIVQCVWWLEQREDGTETTGSTWAGRIWKYSAEALAISGAVTLATLPLVALYFHQVPWLGIVTNLVAVPFTGAVLVPLGLLSGVWTVAAGAETIPAGFWQERLLEWLVQGLRWFVDIPGSEWHVAAPSLPAMLLFYSALWAVSAGRIPRFGRVVGSVCVLCLVGWWVWSPRLGIDGDRWRVTFLDVGQGDSALIELPDGKTVLIDGGARYERFDVGRGIVAPFLWNRGIRRIDHVIGTHQQLDHVGGLIWLLRHVPVGRYWGTVGNRPEQFVAELKAALLERHVPEETPVRGQEILPGGPCRLTVLNPSDLAAVPVADHSGSGSSLNNRSIVTRLECADRAVLFAADIETEGVRLLTGGGRRPVTVLKVPHHGARSSLDREWLREIHPEYAVISVGRRNPYGHPVQAVLEALADEHAKIYRTDFDGAVWVTGRLSHPTVHVTSARELVPHPIDFHHGCVWRCEQDNWRCLWSQWTDHDGTPFLYE